MVQLKHNVGEIKTKKIVLTIKLTFWNFIYKNFFSKSNQHEVFLLI